MKYVEKGIIWKNLYCLHLCVSANPVAEGD